MFEGAKPNDLDQILVPQQSRLGQDRIGDLDFVVGERAQKIAGHVAAGGELAGDDPAHRHFDVADDAVQDAVHHRPLPLAQNVTGLVEEVDHDLGKAGTAFPRLLAGKLQEIFGLELAVGGRWPAHSVSSLWLAGNPPLALFFILQHPGGPPTTIRERISGKISRRIRV